MLKSIEVEGSKLPETSECPAPKLGCTALEVWNIRGLVKIVRSA